MPVFFFFFNFFTDTSGYTSKHHLNFMLAPKWQCHQNNIIAKHLKTVFSHSQYVFVAEQAPVSGHLTRIPLVSAHENHACKRPAPIDLFTDTAAILGFIPRGHEHDLIYSPSIYARFSANFSLSFRRKRL